ncbi:MAG: thiamine pyrophosphate-dependent dehydrogenase E1 component subunit alpha [Anaerolineales bacterium]|nr:thiamine pyrophosphate-dependent dehydrogenase E1 component subunit alpha [Anaerolineales bacterium]
MVLPLPEEILLEMYWTMLLSRRLDERAWALHRQGKITFHISAIGHEAAQIGAAYAIRRGYDWVAPYYRDLTLMLALGYTPREFMLSLMGKKGDPCSGGRQMPSHWSLKRANVISHSSPVATQTSHAAGIGLAIKLRGEDKVVITAAGEGSTSQGEWYEGVNWAAVQKLPVVFMIVNNLYAISVRQEQQMAVANAADKAHGLGLPGVAVDGMDFLAVYKVMKEAVERARSGEGPTVVEAKVYRITPHSSDDDDRSYRTREEVEHFKQRDPLFIARQKLEKEGILTAQKIEEFEQRAREVVNDAVRFGESAPYPAPEEAAFPVYAEDVRHA